MTRFLYPRDTLSWNEPVNSVQQNVTKLTQIRFWTVDGCVQAHQHI